MRSALVCGRASGALVVEWKIHAFTTSAQQTLRNTPKPSHQPLIIVFQDFDFGAPHTPIVENGVAPAGDEDAEDVHGSPQKSGGSAEKKSRKSRAHEV